MTNTYYTFLIDTNLYSGNFERPMTAFITGVIGDCGVGDDFAEMYNEEGISEETFDPNIVMQRVDEDGYCFRPCAIAPTPGYVNNGMGVQVKEDSREAKRFKHKCPAYQSVAIYFSEDPTNVIPFLKERAQKFVDYYNKYGTWSWRKEPPKEQMEIISFRLERNIETAETFRGEYV